MTSTAVPRLTNRPKLPQFAAAAGSDSAWLWPETLPSSRKVMRGARAVRRGVAMLVWTLLSIPVQALMLKLPGRGKVVFARVFWAVFAFLIGLRVRVVGAPRAAGHGRRVIYTSNHSSWLDIPVLGGRIDACFVAKDSIERWPGVSLVAKLGRTVFVSRKRTSSGRERDDMASRLVAGDDLMLFPEGTSSDGSRVLPFRSSFFALAEGEDPPLIQPVSVVYDRLSGLPAKRSTRPVFAWYGDMDLASHFWKLAQCRGMRATILIHPALDPKDFRNRKALAQAAWDAVAGGAAAMRQNRDVPSPAA